MNLSISQPYFINWGKKLRLQQGEVLFREGSLADGHMFIVLEGNIEISKDGVTLQFAKPGEILGELALIDGLPRSASAISSSNSVVGVISEPDFKILILRNPNIALEMMKILAGRVRANLSSQSISKKAEPIQ